MVSKQRLMLALAILLLCCFGAIGVQALPVCQRFVKTYQTLRTRNKVSALTAARWAAWNGTHPNYKPSGNRPKYKYTRKEVVDKVNFACPVPPSIVDTEIALEPLPPVEEAFNELPPEAPPALYHTPDVVQVAQNSTPSLPFVPPYSSITPPLVVADTPEPASLLLLSTGLAALAFVVRRRQRSANTAA